MIIPQFKLSQDSKFVVIIIRIPYVKISNAEFYIEGRIFKFFLHPYLLSIEFKNDLQQAEEPSAASYDHNTYELTVKLQKATEGEHFEDLDMITKLLVANKNKDQSKKPNAQQKKNKKPLIEVIGETSHLEDEQQNEQIEELKQQMEAIVLSQEAFAYGFNNQTKGYFQDLGEEIFELGHFNPDEVPIKDRINLRTEYINRKFDEDAYIFDKFENEEINEYLKINSDFLVKVSSIKSHSSSSYSSEEWNALLKLPNKEFLIKNKNKCLLEIVDILFAFTYELRCMTGDFSCESAATINYISSVLSCFVCDDNLQDLIKESYRRALSLAMIRHFELAQKVQKDLEIILSSGRAGVLKALLQIKHLFDTSEPRYHLNNLYIEDFCIWVQNLKDEDFQDMANQLKSVNIKKDQLNLNLIEIEEDCEEMIRDSQNQQEDDE